MKFSYLVCSMVRSGTAFFKHFLDSQDLGRPRIFNAKRNFIDSSSHTGDNWSLTLYPVYIEKLLSCVQQAYNLPETLTFAKSLETVFPRIKYIYLTRKNVVRHAISWVKGSQTDRKAVTKLTIVEAGNDVVWYDAEEISNHIKKIQNIQSQWEDFFVQEEITPLRLYYEDICEDNPACVETIAEFLKVKRTFSETALQETFAKDHAPMKQADATTDAWETRYRKEQGLEGCPDA